MLNENERYEKFEILFVYFINRELKKMTKSASEAKPDRFSRGITFLNTKDSERESIWRSRSKLFVTFFSSLLIFALFSSVNGDEPIVLKVKTAVNPDNALIIDFKVKLNKPAILKISYWNEEAGAFKYKPQLDFSTSQRFSILRLRAETTYRYSLVAMDQEGHRSEKFTGKFTTGPLPPEIADISIKLTQGKRTTYPLTLFDQNTNFFNGYIAVDSTGQIVWYYQNPLVEQVGNIIKMPSGNYLYASGFFLSGSSNTLVEITPFGRMVRQSPLICNSSVPVIGGVDLHDMQYVDGKILHLGQLAPKVHGFSRPQLGGTIREWNLGTNTDRLVWNPFDFLNPVSDRSSLSNVIIDLSCKAAIPAQDWIHSNALAIGLDNNFIYGSRSLSHVISLGQHPDPRNEEIAVCHPSRKDLPCRQWILGGIDSDFTFPNPDDQFYNQHNPQQIINLRGQKATRCAARQSQIDSREDYILEYEGFRARIDMAKPQQAGCHLLTPRVNKSSKFKTNILLYDDGNERPASQGGQYSRALELELNFKTMEAKKVWEYRHKPDIFTDAVGSVTRLDNGNTVIDFGFPPVQDPTTPPTLRIIEVTRKGKIVAEINVKASKKVGDNLIYRAHVLDTLAGEKQVP